MKKILALLLVLVMTLSLAACGSKPAETAATTAPAAPAATEAPAAPAETEAPAAGVAKVALVTDVGTIDDESFNQACWQGVEAWCKRNNVEYTYYQPTEDSTDARVQSVAQAIAEGADTIVMPGYLFGATLTVVMEEYPDVHFIAVDVASGDLTVDYSTYYDPAANTACLTFSEEQAGYLAGYAAVKDGYTKLGFLGGMAVPAVIRYGFGFVQGADVAAAELGTPIEINYTYGGQFFGDANITAKMEGWYAAGTEVVFACGGGIYTSAVEAAKLHNGKVIGVDVDQSYIDDCIITSAMKQLQNVTETVLEALNNGDWATYGGKVSNFSLAEGDYVGLPTDADSWRLGTFTVDEYQALKAKLADGSVVVDNNSDDNVKPTVSDKTTVNYIG
ncbi:MAG: BMP family ABC transporter substrate-binding protein [Faecousia sp.]